LREIATRRYRAYKELSAEHTETKITLLYDVIRLLLEAMTIEQGFRIYNHECYGAFLEHLRREELATVFNECRNLRNDINYYGKTVTQEQAKGHIEHLLLLKQELER
jgi:hypothetical protein